MSNKAAELREISLANFNRTLSPENQVIYDKLIAKAELKASKGGFRENFSIPTSMEDTLDIIDHLIKDGFSVVPAGWGLYCLQW